MMDAIVQFFREGLSCIKDLSLLHDSLPLFWDSNVTLCYYDFPAPLNQTTPLEVLISLLQLYTVLSLSKAGWTLFVTSIGKLMRVQRFMETRKQPTVQTDDTDHFINASLVKEGLLAIRSMFTGFINFFIGLCFFWLFANSWHITETDWIGGLQGLIHAFTVMNMGLLPLLYFMWKDGQAHLAKATHMENMAQQLRAGTLPHHDLDICSLEALTGWKPFWDAGMSLITTWTTHTHPDEIQEEKSMVLEKITVESSINELFGKVEKNDGDKDDDDLEKENKIRKELWQTKADELSCAAQVTRMAGYREFVYFILNCIAFYGYSLCIICFYYPHPFNHEHARAKGQDEPLNTNTTSTPLMVRYLMFHMDPALADWRGNFAGDLMWTMEAIVIFGSPFFFSWVKSTTKTATPVMATASKPKLE